MIKNFWTCFLWLAMIFMIFAIPTMIVKSSYDVAEFWRVKFEYANEQQLYYFNGANNRDYLDICYDSVGELGVFYKDECVK